MVCTVVLRSLNRRFSRSFPSLSVILPHNDVVLLRSPAQKLSGATDGLQYRCHLSLLTVRARTCHLHRSRKPARRKPGLKTSRSELLAAAVLRVWVFSFSSACGCFPPRMGVPRNKCQLSGFLLNEDLARSLISAGGPDQSSLLLRCCIRLASTFRKS